MLDILCLVKKYIIKSVILKASCSWFFIIYILRATYFGLHNQRPIKHYTSYIQCILLAGITGLLNFFYLKQGLYFV